jgi:hypothetical protein
LWSVGACGNGDQASTTRGGGDSIAGTYECRIPGASTWDIVELSHDGTLTITHSDGVTEPPGIWTVDGPEGFFGSEEEGVRFVVVGDRLLFEDTTECSRIFG